MPVIVVGADTGPGAAAVAALSRRDGEIRAFVSDPAQARELKARGIKVAVGDVSDGSHVGGAALNTFSAVLIEAAATDERERSFAATPDEVYTAWAEGIRDAGTKRVIWVGRGSVIPVALTTAAPETVVVNSELFSDDELGAEVARLDEAASLH